MSILAFHKLYFLCPDEKGMPRDCPEIIYMYLSNMPFWGRQSWRLSAPFRRCECLCFWRGITSGAEFRTYSTNLCLVKMTTCLSTPILLPGVAVGSCTLGQSCSITSATQICFPFDFWCTVKKSYGSFRDTILCSSDPRKYIGRYRCPCPRGR